MRFHSSNRTSCSMNDSSNGSYCNPFIERTVRSMNIHRVPPLPLYFCTFLQPILETIAQEFPSLNIYAYVDDINISSHDVDLIASAYVRLKELLESKSIRLAPQKCVWFDGLNSVKLPEKLVNEGVQIARKSRQSSRSLCRGDQPESANYFSTSLKNTGQFSGG